MGMLTEFAYRWCQHDTKLDGGGIVFAPSEEDALRFLVKKYGDKVTDDMKVWSWTSDDFYDDNNRMVLDIY